MSYAVKAGILVEVCDGYCIGASGRQMVGTDHKFPATKFSTCT